MTRHLRSTVLPLSLFVTSFLPLACGGSSDSEPKVCTDLKSYTSTVSSQLSFATDVLPILVNTSSSGGCAQAGACHGKEAIGINPLGTKKLQFEFDPPNAAMAKAQLLMPSVNASGMQRVTPGSVSQSMMSYKISGKDGLACISSMCQSGASVGTPPCGDPMPTVGEITAADRTKILDWIASGAAD